MFLYGLRTKIDYSYTRYKHKRTGSVFTERYQLTLQVRFRLSPPRPGFNPSLVHMRFMVDAVALVKFYLRVLRLSPVSTIPWMLHTHLYPHVPLTTRTKERSLETFQKINALSEMEEHWIQKYLILKSIQKEVDQVAQSVKRLATGWTVRRSNPSGGEIFRTCPDRPWGPPNLLYNGYHVFLGGRKSPGSDADPSPLLVLRSKNRVQLYLYSP
jgi:hypothetical protein